MRVTGMAMLIVLAAFFMNFVVSTLGVNQQLVGYIQGMNLSPTMVMIGIIILYLLLGCVMDPMAIMITTVPVIAPLVSSLGYNLLWFGILITVLSETGMITPPFGINLFVVQAVRRRGPLNDVVYGAAPFVLALLLLILLLMLWPEIALWLPQHAAAL